MDGGTAQIEPQRCEDKAYLTAEYGTAVSEYSRTVNMLRQTMDILPKAEYAKIRDFIEVARKRTEAAHLALERHIDEHGC